MSDHDDDEIPKLTADRTVAVMERIFAKIENREKLHAIHLDVVALRGEARATTTSVDLMSKTVYGNGTPGLKTHVDRLVQDLIDRRWRERVLWGVVLTTLSGVVMLLIQTYLVGGRP